MLRTWVLIALVALAGCDKKDATRKGAAASDGHTVRVTLETAPKGTLRLALRATWAERHQPLGRVTGLLVAFPRPRALGISPRTASHPFDVVLLDDEQRVVRVAAKVLPGTARRVDVIPNLYRYALLLPAGDAARRKLKTGVQARFTLPARANPRNVLIPVTLQPLQGSAVTVRSELAASPEETAFGLMYRRFLPARGGMLFRFPQPQVLYFYMRNTRIPLDMIFINDQRVVTGVVHRAKPFDETTVGVGPVKNRYVLEVRAGFARKHHITAGAAATFRLPE